MALQHFGSQSYNGDFWDAAHWGGVGTTTAVCTPAYTPNFPTEGEYLVWDNVQTVLHTSVRNTGNVETCVDYAHRHNIGRRELIASNGVYTPDDVIWRFPSVEAVIRPKPRDTITDSEGTVWTILEVGRNLATYHYRCVCRDLIIAEDLDDLIDIETPAITYDDAGVKTKTWSVLYNDRPCRLQPFTAEIADERGIRGLRITHQIFLAQAVVVTNEDRVSFGGRYYEIRGYHNPERIDELPVLDVELVP